MYLRQYEILFPYRWNFSCVSTEFRAGKPLAMNVSHPHVLGLHVFLQEDGGRDGEFVRGFGGEVLACAAPGATGIHFGVAAQVVGQAQGHNAALGHDGHACGQQRFYLGLQQGVVRAAQDEGVYQRVGGQQVSR